MLTIYLAGGIEKSPDGGRGARKKIKAMLKDIKGIRLIDPCDFKINKDLKNINEAEKRGLDWKDISNKILSQDLNSVSNVDCVISVLDGYEGFGTFCEMVLAHYLHKPIIAHNLKSVINYDKTLHPWVKGAITIMTHKPSDLRKAILDLLKGEFNGNK